MKTIPKVIALSLILGLSLGAPARAEPITWTLTDIVFDDGGTASGTFVYDEATQSPTDVNIQTSDGTTLLGTVYTIVLATNPNGTRITKLTLTTAIDVNDFTNELIFDYFLLVMVYLIQEEQLHLI